MLFKKKVCPVKELSLLILLIYKLFWLFQDCTHLR